MRFLIWLSSECTSLDELVNSLRSGGNEVSVLLIQDGVFLADCGCVHSRDLAELGIPVYVSRSHAEERGILSRMISDVVLVEYDKVVDLLMEEHDKIISM